MRLLLGLLLLLAAGAAAHHDGLFPSEGYIGAEDVPGFFAVFAPEVTFGGTVLFSTIAHTEGFSASEAGDCATACRNTSGCGWFNYCNAQVRPAGRRPAVGCGAGYRPPGRCRSCRQRGFWLRAGWLHLWQPHSGLQGMLADGRQLHADTKSDRAGQGGRLGVDCR